MNPSIPTTRAGCTAFDTSSNESNLGGYGVGKSLPISPYSRPNMFPGQQKARIWVKQKEFAQLQQLEFFKQEFIPVFSLLLYPSA